MLVMMVALEIKACSGMSTAINSGRHPLFRAGLQARAWTEKLASEGTWSIAMAAPQHATTIPARGRSLKIRSCAGLQ
jgi:hypothetical protein